jgi:hypothetical protein
MQNQKMEKWKYKYIIFILICTYIIGYPFFTIKYFESHTALKIAAKYILLPIFIVLLFVAPKFYFINIKPLDKKTSSKLRDFFSIAFMIVCATGLFFFMSFSLIITTNKLFWNSETVKIKKPITKYYTDLTKNGRLRHYIQFTNPKNGEKIDLEVYRKYEVGEVFEKEMEYGAWGILYSTE